MLEQIKLQPSKWKWQQMRAIWVLLVLFGMQSLSYGMSCPGTIHFKAPSTWPALYVNVNGSFIAVTTPIDASGWYSFPINTFGDLYASKWFFSSSNNNWDAPAVTKQYFGFKADQNDNFSCADLTGTDLYIMEDLENPGKTFMSVLPPNALYFHMIVPDESDWFQGSPLLMVNGVGIKMVPDTANCGWYTATFFNEDPPTSAIISLDNNPAEFSLGENGSDDEIPVPFDLKAKFDNLVIPGGGKDLYYDPSAGGALAWTAVLPPENRSCNYDLAAIIYDTDASLHGAFTCDNYPNVATTACPSAVTFYDASNKIPCIGVTKNIVQSTLDAARKPIYNPTSGCFASATAFNQIFNSTPGVNNKACYDMKFSRTLDGLWEFDSYNEPGKGFYPLENEPPTGPGTKRPAYGGVLMGSGGGTLATDGVNATALTSGVFPADVNWSARDPKTGLPYIDLYPTKAGEFADGTKPNVYNNEGWVDCPNAAKPGVCRETSTAGKNQHFCFESHASFVYHKGQRFYFRGDDDIWVFINNNLVVDLGGTHLAAPDYVILDTIAGIQDGAQYPIDIFFCDRRTNMSNIRIKTNMYFEQKKSLYYDRDPATGTYLIRKLQTGGLSCEAMVDPDPKPIDGSTLSLLYTLISSKGDTVDGNPGTPVRDDHLPENMLVWGGITVGSGMVIIDSGRVSLPPGRYRLVIQDASDPVARLSITIRIAGNSAFYSVNGKTPTEALTKVPAVDTLVGRMVKFEMAKTANGDVDPEGEANFQVLISSPDLLVFKDSLGTIPYTSMEVLNKADGVGTVSLWATSRKSLSTDTASYSVTLIGSRSAPIVFKFHMPRIAFVSDSLATVPAGVLPAIKPDINGPDAINWAFVNYPTYLVIYDPATNEICVDCDEIITPSSTDSLAFQAVDGGNLFQFSKGRLVLLVRGTGMVQDGSFIVKGAIDSIHADWNPVSFRPPPTPRIELAAMFDKNSDGIPDSLFIRFNRSISEKPEELPDFLVVKWPTTHPDTTFVVGRGSPTPAFTNNPTDLRLQQLFPSGRTGEISNYLSADGLTLSLPYSYDSINTGGIGELQAWFTFEAEGVTMQIPISQQIVDSMPPIIRRADIRVTEGDRGYDTLYVYLTEPLNISDIQNETPFDFRLLSSNTQGPQAVPSDRPLIWNRSQSMATLLYDVSKTNGLRPREGDSVRISVLSNIYAARDTLGNIRSISNPFVRINGEKRPEIQVVYFAEFDEKAKNGDAVIDRISRPSIFHGKVAQYDNPDQVKATILNNYGPILGHVLRVDLGKFYDEFASTYAGMHPSQPGTAPNLLTPSMVVLHYEVYYHTNLGAYVAGGVGSITCADTIFAGDCSKGAGRNIFPVVAWNLTSKDQRLVGTGPYLSNIKVWVTIPDISKSQLKPASKTKRMNFGAMRKVNGNLIKMTDQEQ